MQIEYNDIYKQWNDSSLRSISIQLSLLKYRKA